MSHFTTAVCLSGVAKHEVGYIAVIPRYKKVSLACIQLHVRFGWGGLQLIQEIHSYYLDVAYHFLMVKYWGLLSTPLFQDFLQSQWSSIINKGFDIF